MAYHLQDGFDDYDVAHELWPTVNGVMYYSSAYARFGAAPNCLAQGMKMSDWKRWNMVSNQPTMIFGFAFYVPQLGNGPLLVCMDGASYQCSLYLSPSGNILITNGYGGTTVGTTGPGVIAPLTWYWIDLVITIGALGSIALYVNVPRGGAATLTLSGVNTKTSANSYMNAFLLGDSSIVFNGLLVDDFHAHDITGSAPNAVLGAGTRIYTKMPIGPGALSAWTPTGAAANWDCVNDAPPDDDTTYVLAASSLEDNYEVGAAGIGASNVVNSIVRRSRVRMDDAGPHTFQNGVRSSGVDQLGAAASVASGYGYIDSCSVIDPNTGLPWTVAAADLATPIIYRTT